MLGLLATLFASLLDGVTMVVLVPLLKALFGTAEALSTDSTTLETITRRLLDPVTAGRSPEASPRCWCSCGGGALVRTSSPTPRTSSRSRCRAGARSPDQALPAPPRGRSRLSPAAQGGQLIAEVIADADQSKEAVTAALARFFQNLVLIVSLAIMTCGGSPCSPWPRRRSWCSASGSCSNGSRRTREWAGARRITATVTERLAAIKLIRAYGAEDLESERFAEQEADRYRKRVIRTQRFASLSSPASEVFGGLVIILIIWAAANPAVSGVVLGPEVTIVFLGVALKMMSPIKSISQFPSAMAVALGSAERVFRWLDLPAVERTEPGELEARFEREIVFDRVSFAFPEGDPVLEDLSFTIPRGQVVALVGPSGAGKTTLTELLPRFHEPTGGQILLDGVPLSRLSRRSLRDAIGWVSQDTVVLNDTVFANIAYARPEAGREQVVAAARAANALDFIERLPAGFDTLLGERGTRLSGGQRQRVAIARALLRDPPILILDEATSALDPESERLVQEAIDRVMENRTVLVVAHRLSTVRHADQILVLDDARIVERGTHAELHAANGRYRRLHDLQFQIPETVS
ncbi:MAG: ABC transporter ATP-binding protein [Gemmatimonadales bacterium]